MITERVMVPGSWELNLRPDTPQSVREVLRLGVGGFGHVIVTATRSGDRNASATTLLSLSRYTGILRSRPSEFTIGGPGPAAWLGDEDGKGDILDGLTSFSAATFQGAVATIRPGSLGIGSIEAAGGAYTNQIQYASRRAALDQVCDWAGREWRVTPQLKLDAGTTAFLYPTTTTPVAVVQRRSGGKDPAIAGVRASQLDTVKDLDDYTTKVVLLANSTTGVASQSTTYKDGQGNAVVMERVIEGTNVGLGNETAGAQAQLNRFLGPRRDITISSDSYNINDSVAVGDTIHVFDSSLALVDLTNPVTYRGELIYPVKTRVLGMEWPVRRGMGVYFVAPDATGADMAGATVTDISDWIEYESGEVKLEVGANARSSTGDDNTSTPGSVGIDNPQGTLPISYVPYTPTVDGALGGAGYFASGRWMSIGKTIHGIFFIQIGASGFSGATPLVIGLPVPSLASFVSLGIIIGQAKLYDNGTALYYCTVETAPSNASKALIVLTSNASQVTTSSPFAMGNTDACWGSFTYEAA